MSKKCPAMPMSASVLLMACAIQVSGCSAVGENTQQHRAPPETSAQVDAKIEASIPRPGTAEAIQKYRIDRELYRFVKAYCSKFAGAKESEIEPTITRDLYWFAKPEQLRSRFWHLPRDSGEFPPDTLAHMTDEMQIGPEHGTRAVFFHFPSHVGDHVGYGIVCRFLIDAKTGRVSEISLDSALNDHYSFGSSEYPKFTDDSEDKPEQAVGGPVPIWKNPNDIEPR